MHLLSKTSFPGQPIWRPSLLCYRLLSSARVKLVSAGIAATTSPLFSTSVQYYSVSQISVLPYSPTAAQMFSPPLFSNPTIPFSSLSREDLVFELTKKSGPSIWISQFPSLCPHQLVSTPLMIIGFSTEGTTRSLFSHHWLWSPALQSPR